MRADHWIREAQAAGWRVTACQEGTLQLACCRHGCKGRLSAELNALGPEPEPCHEAHHGQYGATVFDLYKDLVNELAHRRRSLGLSQEDLCAAAGLADGHINKLEAFARTAQFPTLQLWAQTLGCEITFAPAPIPAATARVIDRRIAKPYAANKARTRQSKSEPKALFDAR